MLATEPGVATEGMPGSKDTLVITQESSAAALATVDKQPGLLGSNYYSMLTTTLVFAGPLLDSFAADHPLLLRALPHLANLRWVARHFFHY